MEEQAKTRAMQSQPVPLEHAQTQTQNWREFIDSITPNNVNDRVNGYYIPLQDIQSIINTATNGIRVYFALPTDNQPPIPGTNPVHLYIVAIDANGNDIVTNASGASVIYDTTCPCPTICGIGNILNGGVQ